MAIHNTERPTLPAKRDRYHHGDLRRDLLRVAREEIAGCGAQAMSLASLARAAGVAQSAPYRHFADRGALLQAVAVEGFEALAIAIRDAVGSRGTEMSAKDAQADAYLRFGEENVELYRLMFASRLVPDAEDGSVLDKAAIEVFALLRSAMAAISLTPDVEPDAQRVFLAWAQIHGLVMLKADGFITSPLRSYATVLRDG